VAIASHREESARTFSGHPPGHLTAAGRRLICGAPYLRRESRRVSMLSGARGRAGWQPVRPQPPRSRRSGPTRLPADALPSRSLPGLPPPGRSLPGLPLPGLPLPGRPLAPRPAAGQAAGPAGRAVPLPRP
jgi:hypothetical protein